MNNIKLPPRYVFVAGLHRSGTSLLARLLANHPDISALHAPEVPENEGVFVQGAIPHTARHGIPGHFACDPAQHLTEDHPLNRLKTRQRLEADWAARFDPDCLWRLEKSPVNLLRTRLYQQLFPMCHFIVILRHPDAVAQATAKWSDQGRQALIDHWDHAHRLLLEDLPFLHACLIVRYEDLVTDAGRVLSRACAFLGLDAGPLPVPDDLYNGNQDYADDGQATAVGASFGYGAGFQPDAPLPPDLLCRHPLRAVREAVAAI